MGESPQNNHHVADVIQHQEVRNKHRNQADYYKIWKPYHSPLCFPLCKNAQTSPPNLDLAIRVWAKQQQFKKETDSLAIVFFYQLQVSHFLEPILQACPSTHSSASNTERYSISLLQPQTSFSFTIFSTASMGALFF